MNDNVTTKEKKKPRYADNSLERFSTYSESADDSTINHLSIASKPRFKLTAREAYEQGILTPAGVKEGFLVVLPVKLNPRKDTGAERYFVATDGDLTSKRFVWMSVDIAGNEDLDDQDLFHYISVRMNTKARLHIIVK